MRLANLLNFLNPRAPKGVVWSADEWADQRERSAPQLRHPQPKAWSHEVFPAEENSHPLAYAHVPTPHEEFASVRWTATKAASLFYFQGCRVLGAEGAVISPDNKLFAQFTLPPADRWSDHACFKRRRIPPATPLKGWYATIVWPESAFFFHWMMEALPRMAVLGEHAKLLDGLFVPGPLKDFHVESLALLGIDRARLIPVTVDSHFQPQHLFVPDAFAMYNPPRWLQAWFKRAYVPAAAQQQAANPPMRKRIYVSRGDAPARRLANEDEVLRHLTPLGFTAVLLSKLSMAEQAVLFNEAEIIVAPHGAGLTNLVFCKKDTRVVEIFPPQWAPACFMALASSVGCNYRHVVAGRDRQAGPSRPQFDDIRVSIPELLNAIDAVSCGAAAPAAPAAQA